MGYFETIQSLTIMATCMDGTCCCIPRRSAIAMIAIISLVASLFESPTNNPEGCQGCPGYCIWESVESLKSLLVILFQMANFLLLLASIVENPVLVQIYIWYTLGFVVLGFALVVVDFLHRFKNEGSVSFIEFITEFVFLTVVFRCLPIVDAYRKHLTGESFINI